MKILCFETYRESRKLSVYKIMRANDNNPKNVGVRCRLYSTTGAELELVNYDRYNVVDSQVRLQCDDN